jgi:hypothetical protein
LCSSCLTWFGLIELKGFLNPLRAIDYWSSPVLLASGLLAKRF